MATTKDTRIEVRVTRELKEAFEAAAAYLGQSVSEFVVATVRARAFEVSAQRARTVLSNRDRDRFLAALDAAEPSAALRASAEKYRSTAGRGDGNADGRAAREATR